jgi:hypothetical protein
MKPHASIPHLTLALLFALLSVVTFTVFAQEEDEETEIDSLPQPQLQYFYNYTIPPMPTLPPKYGQIFKDKHFRMRLDSIQGMSRIYLEAMRPYFDLARTEEDLDFMRLTDNEDYETYKEIPDLERKSFELARACREAKKQSMKDTIQVELQNTLNKLFDLREQRKEEEVRKLESDLQKTKTKMTERKANKQTIIKKRMDQMLGRRDDLEW